MLKSELIRPRLKIREGQVSTRPLPVDYRTLGMAGEIIKLFQRHIGRSRGQLYEALRDYEGDSLDYPVIRGLASVVEGQSTFSSDPPLDPVMLRERVFNQGPVTGQTDLFNPATRAEVLAQVAAETGLQLDQIEAGLFADLAEEQLLLAGPALAPGDLIARYNLELARGLLYWAREMRIFIRGNYKDVFKYIKLFKLMYTIRPAPPGYHVTLHGPISPFVSSTIRYGLQFAKFLPALLLCDQWAMEADVQPPPVPGQTSPRGSAPLRYTLTDQAELRTHFKGSGLFDSRLEADFAAEFEAKYSGPKRKWELAREDELIPVADSVMIPDFSLTHRQDGRRALLELVGFWHPTYLRRKLEKIRQAQRRDLILLVYEEVNVAEETWREASAGEVLTFARKPVLKDVLAAVERCAVLPDSR